MKLHTIDLIRQFPLYQYLAQPLFGKTTQLNPVKFWQQVRLNYLETCWNWQKTSIQLLEKCWQVGVR
jgi:hypothetical protein